MTVYTDFEPVYGVLMAVVIRYGSTYFFFTSTEGVGCEVYI